MIFVIWRLFVQYGHICQLLWCDNFETKLQKKTLYAKYKNIRLSGVKVGILKLL